MSENQPPASANRQPTEAERYIDASLNRMFEVAMLVNSSLEQRGLTLLEDGIVPMYEYESNDGWTLSVQLDEVRDQRLIRMHGPRTGLEVENPQPYYRWEVDLFLQHTEDDTWVPLKGNVGTREEPRINQGRSHYDIQRDGENGLLNLIAQPGSPKPSQEIIDSFEGLVVAYREIHEHELPLLQPEAGSS